MVHGWLPALRRSRPDGPRYWAAPTRYHKRWGKSPLYVPFAPRAVTRMKVPVGQANLALAGATGPKARRPPNHAARGRPRHVGQAESQPGCLVLSFDDALYSRYTNALPS